MARKTGKATASKSRKSTVKKRTVSKKRAVKRSGGAQKKRSGEKKRSVLKRILRVSLLMLGIAIGLGVPWIVWLDMGIKREFEGRKWDVPSRVYARPLSLYPGMTISRQSLLLELQAAGYRQRPQVDGPGSFGTSGDDFDIYARAFVFEDGEQTARRFRLRLDNDRVSSLGSADGEHELIRLDPAGIASIYPMHDEDRTLVALDDTPELLVTGLQAVEDRGFKHHHGIAFRGIARAMLANLKAGQAVQGGSTLTQQLVKNYFLSSERTFSRKINEALMAILLELHYEKAEILEAYINEVFLGQQGNHGIHGFGRASEFYFDRALQDLEPRQIALLIGMVRGASFYNPRRNPERALQRRNQVLDIFTETGLLDEKTSAAAKSMGLGVTGSARAGGTRYHAFLELVRRQLKRDYEASDLSSEGLRIFTTLAPSEQEIAQRAVSGGLDDLQARGLPADLQGALVLADVSSGEVLALVGDRQNARNGFNRALDARRQIGSVIKPIVYLLALEHEGDYNLVTRLVDEPISLRQPDGSFWSPQNYDHESHGELPLMEALIRSYNQATVRLGLKLGVANLIRKVRRLGVEAAIEPVPATLLGAVELTPFEVTQMYQPLAAGGYGAPLRAVTAVLTPGGEVLNRYPLRLMPLDNRQAVAVLNFALTEVVSRGTAANLPAMMQKKLLVAGKTGTTNERRDSWFVGYTRDRLAVAWVGRDDNRPAGVTGGNAAMRLWAELFRELPSTPVDLRMPDGANYRWVNLHMGALTDPSCKDAVQIPFIDGTEPEEMTPCLEKLGRKSLWRKWIERND